MSSARPDKPLYTVFVGNISYDTTEEQLKQKFSEVGRVVSFRLNYDRETGKPKGFGFCEYDDKEVAMSAIRNLNGELINGRAVRVDFAGHDKQLQGLTPSTTGQSAGRGATPSRGPQRTGPSLPDALSGSSPSIAALPLKEIHEIMVEVKAAVLSNPMELRAFLVANPQVAHALLQGQILLGMVPMPAAPQATTVPPQGPMAIPSQRPPMPVGPTMGSTSIPGVQKGIPTTPMGGVIPGAQGMQGGAPQFPQAQTTLPGPAVQGPQPIATMGPSMSQGLLSAMPQGILSAMHMPHGVPATQAQPQPHMPTQPQPQATAAAINQQQAAVLQQVMQLTPQQIEQLPPEQRAKVMILRQKVQQQLSRMPGQTPGPFM